MRRKPLTAGFRQELKELTQHINHAVGTIPLTHVTYAGFARDILTIRPPSLGGAQKCKVFDKDLVYFFMLRPDYRLPIGDQEQSTFNSFPFAFILDVEAYATPPHHVAPFDTGAAFAGLYDDGDERPGVWLDDLLLGPSLNAAKRFLTWAFETPEQYFRGVPDPNLRNKLTENHYQAQAYAEIAEAASPGVGKYDLRGNAIEVAYAGRVRLEKFLKFAVFPEAFLEDNPHVEKILKWLQGSGVEYEVYPWPAGDRPNGYLNVIKGILEKYYRRTGVLS